MERHLLSKSTFIRGVQCLKSLYLNKKRPFLRDKMPQERLIVFRRGHDVGKLAHQLFPGGADLSPGHPSAYRKAVLQTKEEVEAGYPVIYEAGFQHEQVLVFLDILVRTGTGWHAYEVKSSKAISDTYLMDAALQYFVISGNLPELESISIIHVNTDYVRNGDIEPEKLFRIVDVTEEALTRQEFIRGHIIKEKETLTLPHSPKIDVGTHCRQPYDCDFIGHCWKNIPSESKRPALRQFKSELLNQAMAAASSKYAFLKLLPMRPAIPRYDGTCPYQEIAYAYKMMMPDDAPQGIRLYDHRNNPENELIPELKADLEGIPGIICFGQEGLIKRIMPDKKLIDLKEFLDEESDYYKVKADTPELEKLLSIFDADSVISKGEYTSDAVAEHNYLDKLEEKQTKENLEEYLQSCLMILDKLYTMIRSA